MNYQIVSPLFRIDTLASLMICVIVVIGAAVTAFSSRYIRGDGYYYSFHAVLIALITCLTAMVCANNLVLLLFLWCLSNALLIKLMVHETSWAAARASGALTAKTFLIGFLCIALGFSILYFDTGSLSIHHIINQNNQSVSVSIALIFIFIGAMTQSGIWPFHRWLISSLNSPTPVSAIMHAGLVNGGGFLLARFSPLYLKHPAILVGIFLVGLFSAIVGTTWKLMQHDVKRMLACSTMGQMGFMFAQCGIGLFPAAIAHLCFHGFFKANLFLSSGSATQEKRLHADQLTVSSLLFALCCAFLGSVIFCWISHISLEKHDTTLFLVTLFFIACTQCVLNMQFSKNIKNVFAGVIFSAFFGLCYGLTLRIIMNILNGGFIYPIPAMNIFYDTGLIILVVLWLCFLFYPIIKDKKYIPKKMGLYLYMKSLNASQPASKTVTVSRNDYSFE
jgi:NAD(P)H-quinone oxidoreductase subunit 5